MACVISMESSLQNLFLDGEEKSETYEAGVTRRQVSSFVEKFVLAHSGITDDNIRRSLLLGLQERVENLVREIFEKMDLEQECYSQALWHFDRLTPILDKNMDPIHIPSIYAVSLCISQKFLDDLSYSNKDFSSVCGLPLKYFNRLEVVVLDSLQYRLMASESDISPYFS